MAGHVYTADGQPLAGAVVGVGRGSSGLYCLTSSNTDGSFLFLHVVVGSNVVIARRGDMWSVPETVKVVEGSLTPTVLSVRERVPVLTGSVSPCRRTDEPEGVISGFVLDSISRFPVSAAQVWIVGSGCGTLSDAFGRYALYGTRGTTVDIGVTFINGCTARNRATFADTLVRSDFLTRRCVAIMNSLSTQPKAR